MVGRAMTDIERMQGSFQPPEQDGELSVLKGEAPVSTMQNYQKEVHSYTKGKGHLVCTLKGYYPCHNTEKVLEHCFYDPEADLANPTGSVFCSHGAGFVVPWYEVEEYMHLPLTLTDEEETGEADEWQVQIPKRREEQWMGEEEVTKILNQTFLANQKNDQKGSYGRKGACSGQKVQRAVSFGRWLQYCVCVG